MGSGDVESTARGPGGELPAGPTPGRLRAVPQSPEDVLLRRPEIPGRRGLRKDGTLGMQPRTGDIFCDASGRPRVLRGVTVYSASPVLADLAARSGFETVWIEMEHGAADFAKAETLCMAVESGGGFPTIRIPDGQRTHVLRALEVGARIVVVPMVNTAEQARQIVTFGKFPPLGARGYNTRSRGLGYGLNGCLESFADANRQTHLFAQIETLEALDNLNSICAVEGLSGIFIGPGDLSISAGCPGDLNSSAIIGLVSDCVRRARATGKHAGILVGPGPLLDAALEAGCDLVFCGGDIMDLAGAWQRLLASLEAKVQAR